MPYSRAFVSREREDGGYCKSSELQEEKEVGEGQDRYRPTDLSCAVAAVRRRRRRQRRRAHTSTPESYAFIELRGCHQVVV